MRRHEAFHNHLGADLDHPLLGKFGERQGDIALRPAGFDRLVRQSLERAGEALPASYILLYIGHALALGYL